ncbi:MAG: hypothetical protein A2902_05515 [Elusimicrobia bacterium RIFCSPLOWO2_01_FULL_64_13]|nr:MAG: hypothetical protein A2902_05515 [Elusimicrobia bacterium RIFCSPLOWO2_01_FULL_64_13]
MRSVTLLLPALNESRNIVSLIESAGELARSGRLGPGVRVRMILVDDGSADGTGEAAGNVRGAPEVLIVTHPRTLGLGCAVRSGLARFLKDRPDPIEDCLCVMDADGSHPPGLIALMAEKLGQGAGLVVASRYAEGGKEVGVSVPRRIMSRTANGLLKILFPMAGIRDYTSGFRLFRAEAIERLSRKTGGRFFREDGFASTPELLLGMRSLGIRGEEVPLVLRYDLKRGPSKMKAGRTILRYLILMARMKLFLAE